jgi:hypothetical protein
LGVYGVHLPCSKKVGAKYSFVRFRAAASATEQLATIEDIAAGTAGV